jgi:hypothetical protein
MYKNQSIIEIDTLNCQIFNGYSITDKIISIDIMLTLTMVKAI